MVRLSRPLLLAATALALASCGKQAPAPQPEASAAANAVASTVAGPETKPGLALSGGRLVLPAVSGNPGAAYFTLANGTKKAVTLAAVDVAGAGMAMLHQTMDMGGHATMDELKDPAIAPGKALTLAPGAKHVMVFDLPPGLKPGGTVEMTLTFADGDKLSAPLTIETPGGGR